MIAGKERRLQRLFRWRKQYIRISANGAVIGEMPSQNQKPRLCKGVRCSNRPRRWDNSDDVDGRIVGCIIGIWKAVSMALV